MSYNNKPLCSVKFSRNLYPQFKRHGLSQIIERFGLSIENRHRALDDAEMVYQFFKSLRRFLRMMKLRRPVKFYLNAQVYPLYWIQKK